MDSPAGPEVPPEPQEGTSIEPAAPACPPERDTRIMRQAVLNAATAILAGGARPVEVGDVLKLAAQLDG